MTENTKNGLWLGFAIVLFNAVVAGVGYLFPLLPSFGTGLAAILCPALFTSLILSAVFVVLRAHAWGGP